MTFANVLIMLSGVGMLLYGMKMMSGGLEAIAGDSLQGILRKATSNRVLGVFVGAIATIAINSSTATTIMTVGFVNSGLLNLTQSIGIIMGANVGTTFSAQVLALLGANIRLDTVAAGFILVGAVMFIFFKSSKIRNIGYVILGFGILFLGVTTMSDGVRPLRANEGFREFLVSFDNPLFALLAGFVVTAIIQSSTATTAMLVALLLETCPDTGVPIFDIPFRTAAFILLGVNIGTSLTTVIASIPASRDSKRAALFHIMYDVIGSVVFGTLILVFPGILDLFTNTWAAPAQQAAMFHTIYNVLTMLLLLPFIKYVAVFMQRIIPVSAEKTGVIHERKLVHLVDQMSRAPSMAVFKAHMETCRMWKIANENLNLALDAFFEKDPDKTKAVFENEKTINYLHQQITTVLARITTMQLSKADTKKLSDMFVILSEIEQIGDRAENIAEYVIAAAEEKMEFSKTCMEELTTTRQAANELMDLALDAYEKYDLTALPKIKELEDKVDGYAKEYAQNHFSRLKEGLCTVKSGVAFTDTLIDLEKCADSAEKIAFLME
ncbi:MAG: Na/Pi cotransporter family protein [Defluviitaleaceae bacterium]|nr:Na/Pi cotransporter family protein [Defluviitaleaceae bacterium]MCL2262843.1 Na/Pi cotransporter family protein [Defluviitaleaceae bacterium]